MQSLKRPKEKNSKIRRRLNRCVPGRSGKISYVILWISGGIFFISILAILLCGIMSLSIFGSQISNGDFDKRTEMFSSEAYHAYSNTMVSKRAVKQFKKVLSEADKTLLANFIADGGHIILTDEETIQEEKLKVQSDVFSIDSNSERVTVGFISYTKQDGEYNDLQIVISDNITSMESTLNHELGHYLDSKLDCISQHDEVFGYLYNNHYDDLRLSDYYNSKDEFFAEVYSLYKTRPSYLKRRCRPLYQYMKEIHKSASGS